MSLDMNFKSVFLLHEYGHAKERWLDLEIKFVHNLINSHDFSNRFQVNQFL